MLDSRYLIHHVYIYMKNQIDYYVIDGETFNSYLYAKFVNGKYKKNLYLSSVLEIRYALMHCFLNTR
jgi:alpha-glucosidase (family GH31 glycosyl hydrolase)